MLSTEVLKEQNLKKRMEEVQNFKKILRRIENEIIQANKKDTFNVSFHLGKSKNYKMNFNVQRCFLFLRKKLVQAGYVVEIDQENLVLDISWEEPDLETVENLLEQAENAGNFLEPKREEPEVKPVKEVIPLEPKRNSKKSREESISDIIAKYTKK